ncbi:RdgB/HAM1 family non-canonical purine NTP pyrophosphatase [Rickettsiales bacterium LUAb2]
MENKLDQLVFASSNLNKCLEVKQLFKDYKVKVFSAQDFNLSDVEETGNTFYENALLKAKSAALQAKIPALADDSGLTINALPDILGVYSARFAGEKRDYIAAIDKLKGLMLNIENKSAYFSCSLVLCMPDLQSYHFEAKLEGEIIFPKVINQSFGYDPIFKPIGYSQTFAEMDKQVKNTISHRAKAFKLFAEQCLQKN